MILALKKLKVAKRQPLKHFKKTLLSPEASKEEYKQGNQIETQEEDNQTSPQKNQGRPIRSKNNKKNPIANNVVHKCNVLTKKKKKSLNKI
jgi:hypothetical protein